MTIVIMDITGGREAAGYGLLRRGRYVLSDLVDCDRFLLFYSDALYFAMPLLLFCIAISSVIIS